MENARQKNVMVAASKSSSQIIMAETVPHRLPTNQITAVTGCHIMWTILGGPFRLVQPSCLLRKKRYPRTLQQIAAGLILGSVRAAEKLLMETASFNSVLGSSALRSYCRRLCTQGKKGTHSVTGFDNVSTSNRKAMQRARVVLDLFFLLLTLSCLGFALYRSLH